MGKANEDAHGYQMIAVVYASECAWCGNTIPPRRNGWWHKATQHVVCNPTHRLIGPLAPRQTRRASKPKPQPVGSSAMDDLRARQAAFVPANRRPRP